MNEHWYQKEPSKITCYYCGSENVENTLQRSGKYEWWEHECMNCGYKWSEEPEWDLFKY